MPAAQQKKTAARKRSGTSGVRKAGPKRAAASSKSSSSRIKRISTGVRKAPVRTETGGPRQTGKVQKPQKSAPAYVSAKTRGMGLTMKFSSVICFLIAFVMLGFSTVMYYQVKRNLYREKKFAGLTFCNALTPLAITYLTYESDLYVDKHPTDLGEKWTNVGKAYSDILDKAGVVNAAVTRLETGGEFALPGMGNKMKITRKAQDQKLVIDELEYSDITLNEEGVVDSTGEKVFWFKKSVPVSGQTISIYAILSKKSIDESQRQLMMQIVGIAVAFIVLGFIVAFVMASAVVKPVKQLVNDMAIVTSGRLDHKTTAHSSDEIGLLANTFNMMTKSLNEAAEIEKEKLLIDSELEVASDIQARLLPERTPQMSGYSLAPFYRSAKDVGGDYYDFIPLDASHLGIIVADVSGKGIIGSMVMSITRTVLRLVSQRNLSAADTLSKTNSVIAQDIRRGMFVTAFYLVLDIKSREIVYSSAGHNPMLVYRADKRKVELANPKGIALGFNKGPIFDKTVKEERTILNSGDMVVLYTDGVVEAMDEQNNEYTEDRFYKFTIEHARETAGEYVDNLVADLDAHAGNAPQSDDITIVCLKVE